MAGVMRTQISLYGSVALSKAHCHSCDTNAFVIDGLLQCCDTAIDTVAGPGRIKRETEALKWRIKQSLKDKILSLQHWRCYLCGTNLNDRLFYRAGNSFRQIRIEFDHFIPKSFCPNADQENIYAMCSLCNRYKGSKIYETRDEAIAAVRAIRERKGRWELYSDIEISSANITTNPQCP